jgi:cytochrome c-type biogenesis protein CcmH
MAWVVFALLTVSVLAILAIPVLRRPRNQAEPDTADAQYDPRRAHDMAVYRDQLDEIDKDTERGVLDADEAAAMRLEVERRMLRAAEDAGERRARIAAPLRYATLAALAVVLAGGAFGLYGVIGRPDLPDRPLAQRGEERTRAMAQAQQGQEMSQLAARLKTKLEQGPGDARGWALLGRTYVTLNRFVEAQAAFNKAIALDERDADLHVYLAETLMSAADNAVTPQAAQSLRKALALAPGHPAARFYLALARAQAGDWQGAYDGWLALAADTPADAPWREGLLAQLQQAAAQTGADWQADLPAPPPPMAPVARAEPPAAETGAAAPAPGPTREDMEAAAEMSAEDRTAMIQSMIQRLADRLEKNPDDFAGWMRLGRAYLVTRAHDKAAVAYRKAVTLQPDNVDALMNLSDAVIRGGDGDTLPDEAVDLLRRVLAIDPENPDALWFVGRAELEAGRPKDARAAWTKLLALLDPASPEHATVKESIDSLGQ